MYASTVVDLRAPVVGRGGLEGAVRQLGLRADDGAGVSVVLATSMEALEDDARRIKGTELLPAETVALLPGPDRFEVCSVPASRAGAADAVEAVR